MWKGRHVGLDFFDLLIEALKTVKTCKRLITSINPKHCVLIHF
jgi:hypothetical protein